MVVIVIPTLINGGFLYKCLDSINKNVNHPVKIHIALGYDNFAKACNESVKSTNSEWVLFLNDDTECRNDFVSIMLNTADNLNADIVGAKLVYPNGKIQHAGVYFNQFGMPYHKHINSDNFDIKDRYVPAVTGACMLVKRDIFSNLCGFDEGFDNGFEDVDFCLKAKISGHKIALSGKTDIIHYEKQTRKFDMERFKKNKERLVGLWREYLFTLQ